MNRREVFGAIAATPLIPFAAIATTQVVNEPQLPGPSKVPYAWILEVFTPRATLWIRYTECEENAKTKLEEKMAMWKSICVRMLIDGVPHQYTFKLFPVYLD